MAFSFFCDQTLAERSPDWGYRRGGVPGPLAGFSDSRKHKCLPQASGFLFNPRRAKGHSPPTCLSAGDRCTARSRGSRAGGGGRGPAAEQPEWWGGRRAADQHLAAPEVSADPGIFVYRLSVSVESPPKMDTMVQGWSIMSVFSPMSLQPDSDVSQLWTASRRSASSGPGPLGMALAS